MPIPISSKFSRYVQIRDHAFPLIRERVIVGLTYDAVIAFLKDYALIVGHNLFGRLFFQIAFTIYTSPTPYCRPC